ncbi:hypothetical protein [Flavobacterium gelidilacus]|uniref:hypothetical protein n=1 Tax=Flavobacterium gelidilacus TaxID=206041 RepID=UPI0004221B06|nr:hypothetical protein [Flavobacterium gelidilacus]
MKKFINILILSISSLVFSQDYVLNINLFKNETKIDSLTLIILNKVKNTYNKIDLDKVEIYQKDIDFLKNDYYIETRNHIILIPNINYINEVVNLKIEFNYLKTNKNMQYIFNFGLGDLTTVYYSKKNIRKLKRRIGKSILIEN